MTDIIMIALVGVMGYYVLTSGVLTGQTPAAPVTYTTPVAPAAAPVPTLQTQCTTEGGVWQGNCCSCPNKDCTNKCGMVDATNEDACNTEDGVWQPNNDPPCCSCPNKECSRKCGSIDEDPSGGVKGTISQDAKLAGVCKSEANPGQNVWSTSRKCCQCPNRKCQHKCPGAAAPAKKSSGGGGQNAKEFDEDAPAAKKQNAKINQCRNLTGASHKACMASYARSYLAGSSSRFGPGYTGRDNFQDKLILRRTVPSPVDFQYEARAHPYYLGPRSPERSALLRRFNSNFSTMRFSG